MVRKENNKMSQTHAFFCTLIWFSKFTGILSVGNINYSRKIQCLSYVYLMLMFWIFFWHILQVCYLLYSPKYTDDGFANICLVGLFINTGMLIYHYVFRGNMVNAHFNKMITFIDECLCEPLKSDFEQKLKQRSDYMNLFTKIVLLSVYSVLFFEFITKASSYLNLITFNKREHLLVFQVVYSVEDSKVYWPTWSFQVLTCCHFIAIDQLNALYLQSMLNLKTECFQHLRRNLCKLFSKTRWLCKNETFFKINQQYRNNCTGSRLANRSKYEDIMMIKLWVEKHEKLKSLCNEFVKIYTPLLVSYFSVMFVILISGVFSITQNQHYYGLAEEILLGLYFLGIIFNLFMLSIAGTNLSYESVRVFEDAFHAPWYDCCSEVKSSLKIICTVSKKPVRLAPFGSKNFNMSLDTFIWVMKTMVSFYMGLAQMKQRLANKMESGESNHIAT